MGVVGLVVAAIIVIQLAGKDDSVTIRGSFSLIDIGGVVGGPTDCSGSGGFDDFGAGMNVTVRNSEGDIIGSSDTRNGSTDEVAEYLVDAGELDDEGSLGADELEEMSGSVCVVIFDVEVDAADFYAIEVGTRGELSYSADELEERDHTVALTLGGGS